ncbi:MAG: YjjI family glycine radical enzyme [Oligoflexia bacterium]|nr:YjjI family glycine radical enzyme [Oligoflexia bacterium]
MTTQQQIQQIQNDLYQILTSSAHSDHKQKRNHITLWAQGLLPYPKISTNAQELLKEKIICDLFEGNAPLTPRYILPDYQLFLSQGSEYLNITPPTNLYEAINALLIIYQYVPSVTGYPVYLGNIDSLLEPFVNSVSREEATNLLKLYLTNVDRTLSNAFVHLNIGPQKTVVGEIILKLEKELKNSVPNLSLKIDSSTERAFILSAIDTALATAKPYFVNNSILESELSSNYGVASCYNTLKIAGGSHTLVRVNLKKVAEKQKKYDKFDDFEKYLQEVLNAQVEIINARARFLVEEIKFFEHSFLARENLIKLENFTSMAGIFGLYECIEIIDGSKLGSDERAEVVAQKIMSIIKNTIKNVNGVYCQGYQNKIGLHAQSGIDSDIDTTPGVRIKIGENPTSLSKQLTIAGALHQYFDTGVSDIVVFDQTSHSNHQGVLTIIEGALRAGVKVLSINAVDSELIRVSGYLIKRSDFKKYQQGIPLRDETVSLGANSLQNQNILNRKQFPLKDY